MSTELQKEVLEALEKLGVKGTVIKVENNNMLKENGQLLGALEAIKFRLGEEISHAAYDYWVTCYTHYAVTAGMTLCEIKKRKNIDEMIDLLRKSHKKMIQFLEDVNETAKKENSDDDE